MVSNFDLFQPFIDNYAIYKSNQYNSYEYNDLKNGFISFDFEYLGFDFLEYSTLGNTIEIYLHFIDFIRKEIKDFQYAFLFIPLNCDINYSNIKITSHIVDSFYPPVLYALQDNNILLNNEVAIKTICTYKNIYISYIKRYIPGDEYECFIVLSNSSIETVNP